MYKLRSIIKKTQLMNKTYISKKWFLKFYLIYIYVEEDSLILLETTMTYNDRLDVSFRFR